MNRFFVFVFASTIVLLSGIAFAQTPTSPFWNAKFIANYEALYPNTTVKSYAFVDITGLDRTYSPPVTSEAECMTAAWMRMKTLASQRNPGARTINWSTWSGKCWQGSKPAEPLGWKAVSRGKAW
jgi:hypothetical protein